MSIALLPIYKMNSWANAKNAVFPFDFTKIAESSIDSRMLPKVKHLPTNCWLLNNNGYAYLKKNRKPVSLQTIIWELENGPVPEDRTVDHIDRNRLGNCLDNLRLASRIEQMHNRQLPTSYAYKGIYLKESWNASIRVKGVLRHLGSYSTAIQAASAYNFAAKYLEYTFIEPNKIPDNILTKHEEMCIIERLAK